MSIAKTIADQIGARAFHMIGARNLVARDDGLTFKVGRNPKRVTHIRVTLDEGLDLYRFEALKIGRAPSYRMQTLADHAGVYFDQLRPLIEAETGLLTSL